MPLGPLHPRQPGQSISLPCAGIVNGRYCYINDLLRLSAGSTSHIVHAWPRYCTPIRVDNLCPFLASHPDQAFAAYIYEGVTVGFRIGYIDSHRCPQSRVSNHISSLANEAVVQERISTEVRAGRLLGPLPAHMSSLVHVSPVGLVTKAHQANSWRMIVDLSHPPHGSVNDGIRRDLCSLCYASVDDAVHIIQHLGRGTELVKLDIKDAYRIVPVHPADYHLLGIRWEDETYNDRALAFSLRSAPKIFSAVADVNAWAFMQMGISYHLHYLDDFFCCWEHQALSEGHTT